MTRDALKRLQTLVLEAEASTAAGDPSAVSETLASMRTEVVNVSSKYGEFRQLFDMALLDTVSRLEAGDLPAVETSLETLRILLDSLGETLANG
jgi:hypothetical protein